MKRRNSQHSNQCRGESHGGGAANNNNASRQSRKAATTEATQAILYVVLLCGRWLASPLLLSLVLV